MNEPGGLRLVGDFTSMTNLSRMARGLAGGLHGRGVALDLVQGMKRGRRTDEGATAAARALHRPVEPRVTSMLDLPGLTGPDDSRPALLVWDPAFAWDVALAQPGWRDADLVVAPCQHSVDVLCAEGAPLARVRTLPPGVDPARWERPAPNDRLLALTAGKRRVGEYATRFLNWSPPIHGMFDDREGLLAAWITATAAEDDAVLMLCWEDENGEAVSREAIETMALEVLRALGKPAFDAAPIGVVPGLPRDRDLPGLFAAFTHFLSLDRGTAWNLGMMEAGAAGLRLIAPDHTSYRAWLDGSIASLVPASRVTVEVDPPPSHPGDPIAGEAWAVDPAAAAQAIRDAVDGRDRLRPTAKQTILREFSWERSASRFLDIADEALALRAGPSARGRGWAEPDPAQRKRPDLVLVSVLTYLEQSTVDPAGRLALLEPLFAAGFPLVLYADRFYRERIDPGKTPPWVTLQPIELQDTEAWRMIAAAGPLELPAERNHGKDTVEFLALQMAKTEVVRRAVEDGLAAVPYAGFIDSGTAKLFDDRAACFGRLAAADLGGLDRVLIPGNWPIRPISADELTDRVKWTMCGGLFFLPAALAAEFDRLALETLGEFLARGRLVWEVNVWALLAGRRPGFFQWYQSDHNDRLTALPSLARPAGTGSGHGVGPVGGSLLG